MLQLLDLFFTILHLVIILLNLFGWIWARTRKANFILIVLTIASWGVLGIWFGWGYCPITDWQWQVKTKLGERNLPVSFIKYYGDKITGSSLDSSLVDTVTLVSFLVAIACSVYFNFFHKRKERIS